MLKTELYEAKEGGSKRLLIALHGLGDSCAGYRFLPSVLKFDWLNYLLVNAPDPYYGGFSWYDFAGDCNPGILRSRTLLFALLDELRDSKGFASTDIVVLGFSQGCLMTWEIGLRYPHRLAGLVGISGYANDDRTALDNLSPAAREQRFLITHGTNDPLIPFQPVNEQIDRLKAAGLHIEWHPFEKEHNIAGEGEIEVIRSFIQKCLVVAAPEEKKRDKGETGD